MGATEDEIQDIEGNFGDWVNSGLSMTVSANDMEVFVSGTRQGSGSSNH